MLIFLLEKIDYKAPIFYISEKFLEESKMELSRKMGIGIVMMIPTFVFSGLFWDLFHCWIGIIVTIVVMGFLYIQIITGKLKSLLKIRQ